MLGNICSDPLHVYSEISMDKTEASFTGSFPSKQFISKDKTIKMLKIIES